MLQAVDADAYVEPTSETLEAYLIERWLPAMQPPRLEATTWTEYSRKVRNQVMPRIGHLNLQKLKPVHLNGLYAELLATGRMDGKGGLLQPLGGGYDLIVLDTPPSSGPMQRAALATAAYALVPTKIDDASIDGLEGLAAELAAVRADANPQLRVLGVVLFDIGAGDHHLRAEARAALEDLLGDIAPVLEATVRHSRRAARDSRRHGQTAAEYEHAALTGPRWIDDPTAPAYSTAAAGLAGDYQRLTDEVLAAITATYEEARS